MTCDVPTTPTRTLGTPMDQTTAHMAVTYWDYILLRFGRSSHISVPEKLLCAKKVFCAKHSSDDGHHYVSNEHQKCALCDNTSSFEQHAVPVFNLYHRTIVTTVCLPQSRWTRSEE